MSTYSRFLPILLLLLPSCAWRMGIASDGFCVGGELADIRIGARYCRAGSVQVAKDLTAMSPQATAMLEEVLPDMVDAAVQAALQCLGVGAGGKIVEKACDISEAVKPAVEKIIHEDQTAPSRSAPDRKTPRRKKKASAPAESESGRPGTERTR